MLYPELLNDPYTRQTIKDLKMSLEKEAWSAKLHIEGKYLFLIPDLYAFCEYLFLTKKNQVISYESIENYVWEGSFASLESIRSLIRRVRIILNKEYIQTVVDTGYIFKII